MRVPPGCPHRIDCERPRALFVADGPGEPATEKFSVCCECAGLPSDERCKDCRERRGRSSESGRRTYER